MKSKIDKEGLKAAWKRLADHFAARYPLCDKASVEYPWHEKYTITIMYRRARWWLFWNYGPAIVHADGSHWGGDLHRLEVLQQQQLLEKISLLEDEIRKVDAAPHKVVDIIDTRIAEQIGVSTFNTPSRLAS